MSERKVPHLFLVFSPEDNAYEYSAFLGYDDACEIIERLAKDHGGEVIERVIDKILEAERAETEDSEGQKIVQ